MIEGPTDPLEALLDRPENLISPQGAILGLRADGLGPRSVERLDRFYRTRAARALDALLAEGEPGASPTLEHCLLLPDALSRLRNIARWAQGRPKIPVSLRLGPQLGQGDNSSVYAVRGSETLAVKLRSSDPRREAVAMVLLESMAIESVYLCTREVLGQKALVLRRIDGPSSKSMIGSPDAWLPSPRHRDVVKRRTCRDLRRIVTALVRHRTQVGDFQFLVRPSDGKVFMNDPNSIGFSEPKEGNYVFEVLRRFESILLDQGRPPKGVGRRAQRARPLASSSPARIR